MFILIDKARGNEQWEAQISRSLTQYVMSPRAIHARKDAGIHARHTCTHTQTHRNRDIQNMRAKTYNTTHTRSTHRYTLAISQSNLYPLALHFAVSLCMKSHSQLWRALRIKRESINKQANCGTRLPLCHEQENIFYRGY